MVMQVIKYPSKETWQQLSQRPTQSLEEIEKVVSPILDDIKLRGDAALFEYAEKFDKPRISNLLVTEEEITAAIASIDVGLKNAIDIAYNNILYFHQQQQTSAEIIETSAGVFCWRKSLPIDKVGVYIPGGTAPLFSTVLMLAIPAKIAGCS